ncbi:MAG: M64 family metallopeptidase, partial [Saprospiraceae bacterium]|nr:M64 family metallopeptidase [Saprospiraceae bacterium]
MKKFLAIVLALYSTVPVVAQPVYDDNFTNAILRIDYFHEGDAESETFKPDRLYSYGEWAGSRVNLIDELNYGEYYYKVYDASTGSLIYSRGFDSYFKEYQTSEPANKGVSRRFHETALIPFPKRPVHFAVEKRRLEDDLQEIYRLYIDPSEGVLDWQKDPGVKVYISQISGPVSEKADIVIVGEGYTAGEEDKFSADLLRFTDIFFWEEPCRSARMSFNIYGLFKPSEDSGIDEPRAGIDKNTAVGASFNAMGAERYVLVEDHRALRDIAGHVPYDAIYVMINHERYGGGGIYNLYCTFTSDNPWSPFLMIHEFGHSFFGLADEYYTSSTAYTDFYPPGYEPAEPNITALLDTSRLKWSHLVAPQTP